LARLQYTLEQYRNGTASIAMGNLGAAVGPEVASTAAYFDTQPGEAGAARTQPREKPKRRKSKTKTHQNKNGNKGNTGHGRYVSTSTSTAAAGPLEEDQTRLLPPVIVPQVSFIAGNFRIKCIPFLNVSETALNGNSCRVAGLHSPPGQSYTV